MKDVRYLLRKDVQINFCSGKSCRGNIGISGPGPCRCPLWRENSCDQQSAVDNKSLSLARKLLKMVDTDSSQNSQKSSQFSQSDLPELLNQYYKRLFPYKYFVQWLSYGGGKGFLWNNHTQYQPFVFDR